MEKGWDNIFDPTTWEFWVASLFIWFITIPGAILKWIGVF